jgi:hypothetical protein
VTYRTARRALIKAIAIALAVAALVLSPLGPDHHAGASPIAVTASCRGENLAGAFVTANVGAGNTLITIAVTNVGTSSCRLGGYPTLLGIRGGHEYHVTITAHGTQDVNLHPTVLAPRMSGALILNTSIGCVPGGDPNAASHTYSGIVILLPHHLGIVKVPGVPLYMPCDLAVSQLGWAKGFLFI